ncbi:MAG: T9SS type A sorting domain-containing protein [Bacteroidota bacterium]|nr:T9SS type A sorting domain-containing protein [Bacteroidota bacterium]
MTTVPYNPSNPVPIDNFAHVNYSTILNDSINWTQITGSVIADSAYNYIIIGNFFDEINTDTINYSCAACINTLSYYLIDDVCISLDSLTCYGGFDSLPCITNINNLSIEREIKVFPNPYNENITVKLLNFLNAEIIVYNIFGERILFLTPEKLEMITLSLAPLPKGIYFLKLNMKENNNSFSKTIIKN